jgi:hypothetical protein
MMYRMGLTDTQYRSFLDSLAIIEKEKLELQRSTLETQYSSCYILLIICKQLMSYLQSFIFNLLYELSLMNLDDDFYSIPLILLNTNDL